MIIAYSGKSARSAQLLAGALEDLGVDVSLNREYEADINWGRNQAGSELNPDISNVTNKRVMRELFAEHGVPMPLLYDNIADAELAIGLGDYVVGRPDKHSKGRGFWLCKSHADIRQALRGKTYRNGKHKKAATHFMEYIEAPREYRVHIFGGKSIRISEKKFGEAGETSTGEYITVKPQHNIKHVRKAAKKAMKAVGLDFGAVDILANDTECWVLEVNSAPHLGGSLPRVYAQKFAEHEEKLNEL